MPFGNLSAGWDLGGSETLTLAMVDGNAGLGNQARVGIEGWI